MRACAPSCCDLIDNERPKVVEVVHWAASNGDRSENGDYLYGKKRLREIDRRIRFLTKRLEIAEVTDPSAAPWQRPGLLRRHRHLRRRRGRRSAPSRSWASTRPTARRRGELDLADRAHAAQGARGRRASSWSRRRAWRRSRCCSVRYPRRPRRAGLTSAAKRWMRSARSTEGVRCRLRSAAPGGPGRAPRSTKRRSVVVLGGFLAHVDVGDVGFGRWPGRRPRAPARPCRW